VKIRIVEDPVAWVAAACLCLSSTGLAAAGTPTKARPGRATD